MVEQHMPTHRVKLIVNPNADLGRAWHGAADLRPVVDEFGGADWAGTVYPTHAIELAQRAAEEGYDLVVACGGDGTVHEVVNGFMKTPREKRPKMGVVPLGSGNDFSHSLGMDSRPAYALRQVLSGKSKNIDVGWLKDNHGREEYWVNAMGIGFDTLVTLRSRKFTMLRGFAAYLLAVVQAIILDHDAPHFQIKTDNETFQENMLLFVVCNGPREGGGFHVQPQARNDDGVFHYAGIKDVSRLMMFRLLPEVMNGKHGRFKQVRMGSLKEMELLADRPLSVHLDGEIFSGYGMDVHDLSIKLLPGELELIA
jgi:diacylglycerol kinase (ATP)